MQFGHNIQAGHVLQLPSQLYTETKADRPAEVLRTPAVLLPINIQTYGGTKISGFPLAKYIYGVNAS